MSWNYRDSVAYGVEVPAWNSTEVKALVEKYNDIIAYDKDMSPGTPGTIFVYVESTYHVRDVDHGSYVVDHGSYDVEGSTPRHRCIREIMLGRDAGTLTSEEQTALDEAHSLSRSECCWVHYVAVDQ